MAQTLEELFKSKQIQSQGGKTAEVAYDIRNSKDIRISSNNVLLDNTGFAAARLLRKNLGARKSETLLESEVTGIRIIRGLSTPVIYGNEIVRITLRTTPMLDAMKAAASGQEQAGGGLIGTKITSARNTINSKLGIPTGATPTYVITGLKDTTKFPTLITQSRMADLEAIRTGAGGSGLGRFLKGLGGGDLKTLGKQALGSAITLAKDKIRGKLFGERSTTGFSNVDNSKNGKSITYNYGSINTATTPTEVKDANGKVINYDAGGANYSKTFTFVFDETATGLKKNKTPTESKQGELTNPKLNFYDASVEGGLAQKTAPTVLSKFSTPELDKLKADDPILLYGSLFNSIPRKSINDAVNTDGTLKPTQVSTFPNIDELKQDGETESILLNTAGVNKSNLIELTIERNKITSDPDRIPKFLESDSRGMYTKKDGINALKVGQEESSTTGLDFVKMKFKLIGGNLIQFRATITGLTETMSPSWDSNKFIGSPFSYYTYSGIERSVSFNFKVFSLNSAEHEISWAKLNELTGMVYPAGYNNISVLPPLVQFTLGDMYHNKASFIESLSYTIDDNFPWEVETKGMILPMIVDVSIGLKFIESKSTTTGKKYSYKPTT